MRTLRVLPIDMFHRLPHMLVKDLEKKVRGNLEAYHACRQGCKAVITKAQKGIQGDSCMPVHQIRASYGCIW